MDIWSILGISKTTDENLIKKAYRAKLKVTRPDDDAGAFMELRKAYECALEYAAEAECYDEDFWDDDADAYEDLDEPEIGEETEVEKWALSLSAFIADKDKICDGEAMRSFLNDSIAYTLEYYSECRDVMYNMCIRNSYIYLSVDVWKEIDKFFSFTVNDDIVAKLPNCDEVMAINRRIKINDKIDFSAFGECEAKNIQDFLKGYVLFVEDVTVYQEDELDNWIEILDTHNAEYIPYECLKVAMSLNDLDKDVIKDRIDSIFEKYGDNNYTRLLNAEYLMYLGENAKAEDILMGIYKNMDTKNYILTYQLAMCFKKLNRIYESYLLVKHLTWLAPNNYMVDIADSMYEEFSKEYNRKLEENEPISDMEHITMARLCVRTYAEHKRAIRFIESVNNPEEYVWEYNITKAFCLFETYDGYEAIETMERLNSFDKTKCTTVDFLEYEEAKARMLYDEHKLEDCLLLCNKILEDYPSAYPILLLRSYADKDASFYEYGDLDNLNEVMSNRPEAALLLAFVRNTNGDYERAIDLVKPFEDICYVQLNYYRINEKKADNFYEYVEDLVSLCEYIRDNEVGAPDRTYDKKSLSLYEICWDIQRNLVIYKDFKEERAFECFGIIETLKDSSYNSPVKYLYLNRLYCNSDQHDKIDFDAETLDLNKVYGERYYYEGEQIILNYQEAEMYDNVKELLDSIDQNKVSKENLPWVNKRRYLYYRAINDFKNAKKWLLIERERRIEECENFWDEENLLFSFYEDDVEDEKELKEAIKLFKECVSLYGKYADMSAFSSGYMSMVYVYMKLGKYKEALKMAKDTAKYTKYNYIAAESDWLLCLVYEKMEDFENVYKSALRYESKSDYNCFTKKVTALYNMGEFEKAANMFLERDEEEEYDKDNLFLALHCRFFENMELDMDFVQKIYDIVSNLMEKYEEARMGYNYATMAEMCMHLGKESEFKKYLTLVKVFEWGTDIRGEKRVLTRIDIWSHIMKGELREAYNILNELDAKIIKADYEFGPIKYHLTQMDKKGQL